MKPGDRLAYSCDSHSLGLEIAWLTYGSHSLSLEIIWLAVVAHIH